MLGEDERNELKIPPTKIKKQNLNAPGLQKEEESLFDSATIETETSPFNVVHPGAGLSDQIMKATNPRLLAISKKQRSPIHPVRTGQMRAQSKNIPLTHGVTSMLTKKPLSDLPEPSQSLIEYNNKQEKIEESSLDFDEDPIAYFSKRKDGRGHLFIYLKWAKDPKCPDFSPYELVKTTYKDVGKNYFSMSASGVTHFYPDGTTEISTLDHWAREESIYKSIRKLHTFKLYLFWKPFKVWKNFITQQHYNETKKKIIKFPLFYNLSFASGYVALASLVEESDQIIEKYLLQFAYSKKYKLDAFDRISSENIVSLVEEYTQFIQDTATIVNGIFGMLSDKELLKVTDQEFAEIRRKNPNIGTLVILERKKESERIRRTEQMDLEIKSLSNFLRMVDYMMLEALRNGCYKSFTNAQNIICQEQSSIFVAEVYFNDEGKVSFNPSIDELMTLVFNTMNKALSTLENLPRLLRHPDLRHILLSGDLDVKKLLDGAPDFPLFARSSNLIGNVMDKIKKVLLDSYSQAETYAQIFKEFYPLYKLGKTWDVRNFIVKLDKSRYDGPLQIDKRPANEPVDQFLLHPENEPYIDFTKVRDMIMRLKEEEIRVREIRAGVVKGAVYIDSKELRHVLSPIPSTSLKSLEEMLRKLMELKIALVNRALKDYMLKLKVETTSVEIYTDFCELLQKTEKLMPQINEEIKFVERVNVLLQESDFQTVANPLPRIFKQFLEQRESSLKIQQDQYNKFTYVVQSLAEKHYKSLEDLYSKSMNIPITVNSINLEEFLEQTIKLKKVSDKLIPQIVSCNRFQKILDKKFSDFSDLSDLEKNIKFSEALYNTVKKWEIINQQVNEVAFNHITMDSFKTDVSDFKGLVEQLKKIYEKTIPIISELNGNYSTISPTVDDLTKLSQARMNTRHWVQLFQDVGQKDQYNENITIAQLIKFGILNNTKRIDEITTQSIGENRIENAFQAIKAHWKDITIPLVDNPTNDPKKVNLANTDNLIQEINDSAITLNGMLNDRFVSGIKANVMELANMMDTILRVITEWKIFQSNWSFIGPLFQQNLVKKVLPNQHTRYQIIEKKWHNICVNTLQDTRIIEVCSYPTIYEDFKDFNTSIEIILSSLTSYLDMKRELVPRFYLLSNYELLRLLTTTDFSIFTSELSKIMMHITRLDSQALNANDSDSAMVQDECNFPGTKIFGIAGEDGDILNLTETVVCSGAIEEWVPELINSMKKSVRDAITLSLSRYASSSLNDWMMTASTYIGMITLNISFTRDIEDCFNNLETNPKGFQHYASKIKKKVQELISTLANPLSPNDAQKISIILSILLSHYDKANLYSDRASVRNWKIDFENCIVYRYDAPTMNVLINYKDHSWSHAAEFWGCCPSMIMTPAIETALQNILTSMSQNLVPVLYGQNASGKSELIHRFAAMFGQFIYHFPAYTKMPRVFIRRAVLGTILTGSWLHFSQMNLLTSDELSFTFDQVNAVMLSLQTKNNKYTVGDVNYQIHNDTYFFYSATTDDKNNDSFMQHVRLLSRPVCLSMPVVKKYMETLFITLGFKSAHQSAAQLESLIQSICSIFNFNETPLLHANKIINSAVNYLRIMMHSVKVYFTNYYDNPTLTEQYCICRAVHNYFCPTLNLSDQDLLIETMYKFFPMFDNETVFKVNIYGRFDFPMNNLWDSISKTITDYVQNNNLILPINYLVERTYTLVQQMMNFNCIVICGPPNSGKSMMIKLLEEVYNQFTLTANIVNNYKGILQLKVIDLFHYSHSWSTVFGKTVEKVDPETGVTEYETFYGLLQNAINQLGTLEKTKHRILRFDGAVTPKFAKFLYQLVCDKSSIRTNLMERNFTNNTLHVFVETDSLANFTPELLSKVAIINMDNLQFESGRLSNYRFNALVMPTLPFDNAVLDFPQINAEIVKVLKNCFVQTSPIIYKKVQMMNSQMNLTEAIDRICSDVVRYCLASIKMFGIDSTDELKISNVLGYAFYRLLSSCVEDDSLEELHKLILEQFNITLSQNWDIWALPEAFIETFPTPSLLSTQITKDNITPIDSSDLQLKPIFTKTSDEKVPILPSEISIVLPQILPSSNMINYCLKYNRHFMMYGDRNSGRNHILKYILTKYPDIIHLRIKLSPFSRSSEVLRLIQQETLIMSRTLIRTGVEKKFLIVFDGFSSENLELIELLREMITRRSVCFGSKYDAKYAQDIAVKNFIFAISCHEIKDLPVRFSSLFVPIKMKKFTENTLSIMYRKLLNTYTVSPDFFDYFNPVAQKVLSQKYLSYLFILSVHSPAKKFETEDDKMTMLSILYYAMYNSLEGSISERKQKMKEIKEDLFKDDELMNKFFEKQNQSPFMSQATFIFTPPDCNYIASYEQIDLEFFKNKLILLMRSSVTDETMFNFCNLDYYISIPGAHISLSSISNSGRMTLINNIINYRNYQLYDFTQSKIAKSDILPAFNGAVFDNKIQIICVRCCESHDSKENLEMIRNIFVNFNFLVLFNDDELRDLLKRINHVDQINHEIRYNTIEKIKSLLRTLIRIVVLNDIKKEIPGFVDIEMLYPSKSEICRNYIDEDQLEQLKPIFIEISDYLEKTVPMSSITMFNDFVNEFRSSATGVMSRSMQKNQNVNTTITFITRLRNDLTTIQDQIEETTPKLEKMRTKSENLKNAYSSKHDAIDMRRLKLNEEYMFRNKALHEMQVTVEDTEKEMKSQIPMVESRYTEIAKITIEDLKPISIISDNPPDAIRECFTVIPTLLGEPGNYEKSGIKLMKSEIFGTLIHDGIDYNKVRGEHLALITNLLQMECFSMSKLESLAPVMVTIRRFFEAIAKYHEKLQAVMDKKMEMQAMQNDFDNFNADMKRELESIHDIEEQFVDDAKELKAVGQDLDKLEKTMATLNLRNQNAKNILEGVDPLVETWTNEQKRLGNQSGEDMTGDVILVAIYLSYCGCLDIEKREEVLAEITNILTNHNISTSFTNPLKEVSNRIVSQNKVRVKHELLSHSALIDLEHLFSLKRTPLLIDSDKVIYEALLTSTDALVVSLYSEMYEQVLAQAAKEGKLIIICDVDKMNSKLTPLTSIKPGQESTLKIMGGEKIKTAEGFFPILFATAKDEYELDPLFADCFAPINVQNSSMDVVKNRIIRAIVGCKSPDLLQQYDETNAAELEHQVQTGQREFNLLEIFAKIAKTTDSEGAYLSDTEALKPLLECKALYFASVSGSPEGHSVQNKINEITGPLQSEIQRLQTLWMCLARFLPTSSSILTYKFSEYEQIIKECITRTKQDDQLKSELLNAVVKWISPGVTIKDLYFFLTIFAFHEEDLPWDDLVEIVANINQAIKTKKWSIDFKLPMPAVLMLKDCSLPEFHGFLNQFIQEKYGDVTQYLSPFQPEVALAHSGNTATLILCKDYDPMPEIFAYAQQRARVDSLECLTLTDDSIDVARRVIKSSVTRANWLIISYVTPSIKTSTLLNTIPDFVEGKNLAANFRLIIICKCIDHLSQRLLTFCKKMVPEEMPSARSIATKLLQSQIQNLRNATKVKPTRRLFHAGLLTYISLLTRSFVPPLGFQKAPQLSPNNFYELFREVTQRYVDRMDTVPLNMVNMRTAIQDTCFGGNSLSPSDRRVVRAILTTIMPSACLEDNFNCLKDISTPAPYQTPGDGPLQQYQNQLGLLPYITSQELMFVPDKCANLLLSIKLSKLFSEPFIKIGNVQQLSEEEIDKKKEEFVRNLPLKIAGNGESPDTPMKAFWARESCLFNELIDMILNEIENKDLTKEFTENVIPSNWDNNSYSFDQFWKLLIRRHDLVSQCLAGKDLPQQIDAELIARPKQFLTALSSQRGTPIQLSFNQHPIEEMSIIGLKGFNCRVQGDILITTNDIFTNLPPVYIMPPTIQPGQKTYVISVYENLESGDSEIIAEIESRTDSTDRAWLLSSAAIYWHLPPQLL
ncbi:Dynein heavy chain family protein [Trichomonas vaginalis G3]|uniref:Dynein heavy chain family protein n=1 Tax=Trichomonas vaginalis (strain ATCC PRA-98 / G3) TaxID=412133 RepID=A2F2K7_TRIV3|nr:dynein heavy chain family protein family [Trichomonas vaginalis G3]EAY00841.1 Dynein heavy chain family protein [Trichomonas vaginalis G3]KAI5544596.1 dynein heavy chain family protein family [Trichomonas vaginalis G3]|eukprot:XP_001313770.1 Dynein heavy chain family protein [Trichomonas vaginalis G3]